MIVDKVRALYDKEEEGREWDTAPRCSSAGKCVRALGYQLHGYKPDPLNFRARMVFRLGDLIESDLVDACVKCLPNFRAGTPYYRVVGGDTIQSYEQFEVTLNVHGFKVMGHLDGYLVDAEGKPDILIDFKSMSKFGYDKAEKGEIDPSYIAQAHCYMKAMGCTKFMFVCYCKDTSAICEVPIRWNARDWEAVDERFRLLSLSSKESLPPREYSPNSNGTLPWQCSYCAFNAHCWPSHKVEFSKAGKPSLKVIK